MMDHGHLPTLPDDNIQMVLGSQSLRDEIQMMIAQQMKLPAASANSVCYAARGKTVRYKIQKVL